MPIYGNDVMYFPVQLLITSLQMHNKIFVLICTNRNRGITTAL